MAESKSVGLLGSLRQLLGTALETAHVRLELLGTELEFEKRRIFDGLVLGAVALVFLGLGLVLLCGTVILFFWEGYRLMAAGLLTVSFLAIGLVFLGQARQRVRAVQGMFQKSVAELQRDQALTQDASPHAK
jgi:uncharacterized membrane protein YqjE